MGPSQPRAQGRVCPSLSVRRHGLSVRLAGAPRRKAPGRADGEGAERIEAEARLREGCGGGGDLPGVVYPSHGDFA